MQEKEDSTDAFDCYDRITKSPEFAGKKDKIDYLAHFFVMLDSKFQKLSNWQIGFYNKKEDLVIVFELTQDSSIKMTESKPLKLKEQHIVEELSLNEVKINFETALENLKKIMNEKYPGNFPMKTMVLLQEKEKIPIWNLTVVTNTYNTLNVKLDAKTGKVIDHSLSSLLSWGTK
ncbi:hypothetical protein GF371_04615 [Candidatus Woesearchaeota archaeon]|nr:hypothetical protein [Candidatus Woesearchaeota archaeon]